VNNHSACPRARGRAGGGEICPRAGSFAAHGGRLKPAKTGAYLGGQLS